VVESKLKILAIFGAQSGNLKRSSGKIDALMFGQQTPIHHLAFNVLAANADNAKFDQSIGEQNPRTRTNLAGKTRKSG